MADLTSLNYVSVGYVKYLNDIYLLSKHPKSAVFLFHNQTLIFALKKVCSV
jgi:hypothetical protein